MVELSTYRYPENTSSPKQLIREVTPSPPRQTRSQTAPQATKSRTEAVLEAIDSARTGEEQPGEPILINLIREAGNFFRQLNESNIIGKLDKCMSKYLDK